MKLRWRIAATFTGALGLVAAGLGAVAYVELDRFLVGQTAAQWRSQSVATVEAYRSRLGPGLTLDELAPGLAGDLSSRRITALVLDRSGQVLAGGPVLPDDPSPAEVHRDAAADAASGLESLRLASSGVERQLVVYLPLRDRAGMTAAVIQLNGPIPEVAQALDRARLLWMLITLGALAAGAGLAVLFGRYLAAPLEQLEAVCRAIAAGDWGQRSNLRYRPDEVGRLAAAFDEMVHRLEAAFAAQRRFVADAAHQLKTPLMAVGGSLELLERAVVSDPAGVARMQATIREQLARLERMVRKLVTLSALEAGSPLHRQSVELARIAREVVEEFRPLAAGREVRIETAAPGTVDGDPERIREALANLVDNALRHTQAGGRITIEVAGPRVIVRDTGEGIPPERLPRIFDRFYRYPPSSNGSGLGLAIVKSIVDAHGGSIRAESTPGLGTAITLTFPTAP